MITKIATSLFYRMNLAVLLAMFSLGGITPRGVIAQAEIPQVLFPAGDTHTAEIVQGEQVLVKMSENGLPRPFGLQLSLKNADAGLRYHWEISAQAGHGTAQVEETGEAVDVHYQPAQGYVGEDAFMVAVSTTKGQADRILVQVSVVSAGERLKANAESVAPTVETSTFAFQTDSQVFEISLNRGYVRGVHWAPLSTVTVYIDDPSTEKVPDYFINSTVDANGQFINYEVNYPVKAGLVVAATNGTQTKSLIVSDIGIDAVNTSTDTISGWAAPESSLQIQAFCSGVLAVRQPVVADSYGSWTADFSTSPSPCDLNPGDYAYAIQGDSDGDFTSFFWKVNAPSVEAEIYNNSIWGHDWVPNSTVTVTVDDPTIGTGSDFSTSQDVDTLGEVGFFFTGLTLKPGMIIKMTDGSTTRELVVAYLDVINAYDATDLVVGKADPGAPVIVEAKYPGTSTRTAYADSSKIWTADFSQGTPFDITSDSWGYAYRTDSDGDRTSHLWYVKAPAIVVNLTSNVVAGYDFLSDTQATLTIDDPLTQGVDYTAQELTDDKGIVQFQPYDFQIEPQMIVTLTDGTTQKTHTVKNIAITTVDQASDTFSGIAAGSSVVDILACDAVTCFNTTKTSAASGQWSADLTGASDIAPGSYLQASQIDGDGDRTVVYYQVREPNIIANLDSQVITGQQWNVGYPVTVTVEDWESPTIVYTGTENPDYTGYVSFDAALSPFSPGMVVTMTDGIATKDLIIRQLSITDANQAANTVTGSSDPNTEVNLWACTVADCQNLTVTADTLGVWTGSFSIDITVGTLIYAMRFDSDHDANFYTYEVTGPEPVNNEASAATLIVKIPATFLQDTTGATQNPSDPPLTGCSRLPGLGSVWFKYTAATNREISLDTKGSDYDTMIGVWTGTPGNLTEVACNDDAFGTVQSNLTVAVTAGTDYYIGVSKYNGYLQPAGRVSAEGTIKPAGMNGGNLVLHARTFADVIPGIWYYGWVEGFYDRGITNGCNLAPFRYCPDRAVTRAEMAVFILRSVHADALPYTPNPDPAYVKIFADVPVTGKEWMQPWIEEFYGDKITYGCGFSGSKLLFCPERQVTRAEMAVFVLRAKYGAGYQPPAVAVSSFSDLPVAGKEWMMPWMEEFYKEGLTTGCRQAPTLQYCPEQSVTRAEMATFLDRAFGFTSLP